MPISVPSLGVARSAILLDEKSARTYRSGRIQPKLYNQDVMRIFGSEITWNRLHRDTARSPRG